MGMFNLLTTMLFSVPPFVEGRRKSKQYPENCYVRVIFISQKQMEPAFTLQKLVQQQKMLFFSTLIYKVEQSSKNV